MGETRLEMDGLWEVGTGQGARGGMWLILVIPYNVLVLVLYYVEAVVLLQLARWLKR